MGWQLLQRALVHSIWIIQPPLSKSELEVTHQAMVFLFFVMHTKLDYSGLNQSELVTANQEGTDGLKPMLM